MADLKRRNKITSKKTAETLGTKDYANDPFFVKKRERAKKVIDKYGIPEKFLRPSAK
jgi:hypothetical protein